MSGGLADEHRIAVNDLITLATVLQTAVRGVGAVLSGGRAGVGGRKTRDVEAATELHLVAEPVPAASRSNWRSRPSPRRSPLSNSRTLASGR